LETTCDIEIVGGDLDLTNCFSFKLFKKLLVVKGDLYVDGCKLLSDFGSLQDVGGKIHIGETPLEEMYKSGELEKMYPQFKGKFVI
jgi:hypothetical protein